jgi:hypothetical protein
MNTLSYKGYEGLTSYNATDKVFHGKILGISDLVTFESETANELLVAFQEAVDDYLETCKELDKEPDKGGKSMRENGYYWVIKYEGHEPEIAYFKRWTDDPEDLKYCHRWDFLGTEISVRTQDIFYINEIRILPPQN